MTSNSCGASASLNRCPSGFGNSTHNERRDNSRKADGNDQKLDDDGIDRAEEEASANKHKDADDGPEQKDIPKRRERPNAEFIGSGMLPRVSFEIFYETYKFVLFHELTRAFEVDSVRNRQGASPAGNRIPKLSNPLWGNFSTPEIDKLANAHPGR
jgi:hypothetical protein